jgi:plasmid stabilization system protein ParE
MEKEIVWSPQAAYSLAKVLIYLETEWSKRTADSFFEELLNQLELIKLYPEIGIQSPAIKSWRKILITKHNALIYRTDNEKIILLNIVDTRSSKYYH